MVMQRFPAVTNARVHCRGCSTLWLYLGCVAAAYCGGATIPASARPRHAHESASALEVEMAKEPAL